ncbi:hypothetical protein BDBG_08202 [Blastomyces gilchristii SLH14081]|uniref:Uncharacterized protein n=1 Tax=Blastomyces gilchristii (strain SLH14081) TaxID=559298 RepID=A0A179V0I8_BLAGS|nr:uncharacterized protein BDBG_08202 [Blastomyces gilchristii SLH14081]OAT12917.1 hypothetical protein BDBG_08202 [Blastomyces gilchristii SLH14081]
MQMQMQMQCNVQGTTLSLACLCLCFLLPSPLSVTRDRTVNILTSDTLLIFLSIPFFLLFYGVILFLLPDSERDSHNSQSTVCPLAFLHPPIANRHAAAHLQLLLHLTSSNQLRRPSFCPP